MGEGMKKFTYDAFISYRHQELDKFVAENLHKQLEAFRLPGNIAKKKSGRTKIERVFRDKDELPLTSNLEDPIMEALRESEYLIVICSPRLKQSMWCKREIETFIEMHGREKVLAVLIEGEPEESFPDELLFAEEKVEKPDGTVEIIKKTMEPLAADVRGKNRHAMLKAMRREILRLLAPMFSVSYDDLRQRHRERRMKRILTASLLTAVICLIFGTVSTAMAMRIRKQNRQIEAQNEEIKAQTVEIQKQNEILLENQAVSLAEESARELQAGDRIGAVTTAVQALTTYGGIRMPYTPEAQFALTESLQAYDCGRCIKPRYQLKTAGIIDFMEVSDDGRTLITGDWSGTLTVWDVGSGTVMEEIRNEDGSRFEKYDCAFLGNDRFAYHNGGDGINIYSISERRVTDTLSYEYVSGVYSDRKGKFLLLQGMDGISLFDGATLSLLSEYTAPEGCQLTSNFMFSPEGDMLAFEELIANEENGGGMFAQRELHFWDLSGTITAPLDSAISLGDFSVKQIQYRDDTAYVLMNYMGKEYRLSAVVFACRPQTAEILWQNTYDGCFGNYLLKPYAEGADKLLFASSYEAKLIREADGLEYAGFPIGSHIVGSGVFLESDMYLLFTRSGEYHIINTEFQEDYLMEDKFRCHSRNVMDFLIAADRYLVLPHQDNRVTVYEFSVGADCTEYTEIIPGEEPDYLQYNDAVGCAQEKGLAKADLARYVFYNQDKSLLFVCYSDNSLEAYDTRDMSLRGSLTGMPDEMYQFLGTDKDGNMFIRGPLCGYILNPDFKPIALIEGLAGIDTANNRLFVKDTLENQYVMPFYTVEELLAKAEEYVLR